MGSLGGWVRSGLSWLGGIAAMIALAVVAHRWPFLAEVQHVIDRHQAVKVGAIVMTALSGLTFLGAGLYAMATGVANGGEKTPGTPTADFQVELSMREIKTAWRTARWTTDSRWRFMFVMMTAGALMGTGLLATIFVFGDVFAKLLTALMFLYAFVRTVWAFGQA